MLTGDAVLLKTRNGASYTVLPKQLFPAATLADVRQRIADASTS